MTTGDLYIQYKINKDLMRKLKVRNEIFYMQINVTNRCSDNCWHCYLKKKHNFFCEIETKEFIEILKQGKGIADNQSRDLVVDLIGGDPLLKPNIDILLKYLAEKKIDYGIKGNPYLLTENIEKLVSFKCKRYQMSLDGLEKTHDAIRSLGSFQATLNAIRLLNKYQIPVTIKYTISKKNNMELWKLLYLLYEQDIHISNFLVSRYHEEGEERFHISEKYYEETFEELKKFYKLQIENKDIKINIALKEHLWIPFLAKKQYLFKDFFELVEKNPYLSSCSMIFGNSLVVTSNGFFDVCPKISGFKKTNNLIEYMKRKEEFVNRLKDKACNGCILKKECMGCPAFYTEENSPKDCDCFFYER